MSMKHLYIVIIFAFSAFICSAKDKIGADIPWTTYEAEKMKTNGTVLGPQYGPFMVETESSGQKCVKLSAKSQFVEFTATTDANSLVIRYSLPDNAKGEGTHASLGIYKNGKLIQQQKISSYFAWLYGNYPFSNDPKDGKPRNFYDEARLKGIEILKGDIIRVQRDDQKGDDADYCIIDFVDVEKIAPLTAPANSLSIMDKEFADNNTSDDCTEALLKCITKAGETGKTVWIPAGTYKLLRGIALPSNITIQGAGMWYTTFVGYDSIYPENSSGRVRFRGEGNNIHISDFALIGKLNYRDDSEPNDGIVGSFGTNSTVSRIWVEHTKTGVWVENSKNLLVEACRFRNTIADGVNFCIGMAESTIQNCTARGNGDDCFAMWPATFLRQDYKPGKNVITHCTAQFPFLANGAAIYGGESNRIEFCSFIDICPGSAILLSTTFPIADDLGKVNNTFSGTTVVKNCDINTSGGFDHGWQWRAAVQICLDKRGISGIEMSDLNITNSFSDGLSVIAVNEKDKVGVLSNAVLKNCKITTYGLGTKDRHGLWISNSAHGSLTIEKSKISETKNESKDFTIVKQ
jgi:hypothetical protein